MSEKPTEMKSHTYHNDFGGTVRWLKNSPSEKEINQALFLAIKNDQADVLDCLIDAKNEIIGIAKTEAMDWTCLSAGQNSTKSLGLLHKKLFTMNRKEATYANEPRNKVRSLDFNEGVPFYLDEENKNRIFAEACKSLSVEAIMESEKNGLFDSFSGSPLSHLFSYGMALAINSEITRTKKISKAYDVFNLLMEIAEKFGDETKSIQNCVAQKMFNGLCRIGQSEEIMPFYIHYIKKQFIEMNPEDEYQDRYVSDLSSLSRIPEKSIFFMNLLKEMDLSREQKTIEILVKNEILTIEIIRQVESSSVTAIMGKIWDHGFIDEIKQEIIRFNEKKAIESEIFAPAPKDLNSQNDQKINQGKAAKKQII